MRDVKNILLIRLKSMGDVVFTLPATQLVRENFPKARITYLTSTENASIVAGFGAVDEVVVLDRRIFKQHNPLTIGSASLDLVSRLRREKFSLVVDWQSYGETALLSWLTRAPERWSFQTGKKFRRHAATHLVPRRDDIHPVDANLEMLTHLGLSAASVRNQFHMPRQGRGEATLLFSQHGVNPDKPILFIQPFTSSANKNWPLENHLLVARHWRGKGTQVVFGGGPGEQEQLQSVHRAGYPVFAGLPLSTVIWLIHRSTVVLGGDTGLVHLAVSMGRRVLALMAGGAVARPYGHSDWVLSPAAGQEIAQIKANVVNDALAVAFKSA